MLNKLAYIQLNQWLCCLWLHSSYKCKNWNLFKVIILQITLDRDFYNNWISKQYFKVNRFSYCSLNLKVSPMTKRFFKHTFQIYCIFMFQVRDSIIKLRFTLNNILSLRGRIKYWIWLSINLNLIVVSQSFTYKYH